jgi:hypothetical protein
LREFHATDDRMILPSARRWAKRGRHTVYVQNPQAIANRIK